MVTDTSSDYVTITSRVPTNNINLNTKINLELNEELIDEVVTNMRYEEFDKECNDIVDTLNYDGEVQLVDMS